MVWGRFQGRVGTREIDVGEDNLRRPLRAREGSPTTQEASFLCVWVGRGGANGANGKTLSRDPRHRFREVKLKEIERRTHKEIGSANE